MADITKGAIDAFEGIKFNKESRWVIFKITKLQIVVDKTGDRKESYEEFVSKLPANNCRFALYDFEAQEALGRNTSKLYFIMWSPENANDQDRVTYTQALPIFKERLTGITNFSASEKDELRTLLAKEKQHS